MLAIEKRNEYERKGLGRPACASIVRKKAISRLSTKFEGYFETQFNMETVTRHLLGAPCENA